MTGPPRSRAPRQRASASQRRAELAARPGGRIWSSGHRLTRPRAAVGAEPCRRTHRSGMQCALATTDSQVQRRRMKARPVDLLTRSPDLGGDAGAQGRCLHARPCMLSTGADALEAMIGRKVGARSRRPERRARTSATAAVSGSGPSGVRSTIRRWTTDENQGSVGDALTEFGPISDDGSVAEASPRA